MRIWCRSFYHKLLGSPSVHFPLNRILKHNTSSCSCGSFD
uniref:Uncharacterized protein n=1 Tax=Arundo donax TaxID=35708 RepID=A0A0A9HL25_ARUDO